MGRPASGDVLGTFSPEIKQYIVNVRKKYPGWGAKTIYVEMQADPRFSTIKIPSIRSIGTLLKARGLVRVYDKHVPIPDGQVSYPDSPHQVWQLDAQGSFKLNNVGPITMINIKDVFSLVYCMAYPNLRQSIHGYSKRLDYQCALRLAFLENGLPEEVQTDHESIFYENKGKSPFPTLFHLWLISLGISKVFSRFHVPTDQGLVERMHQTIEQQAVKGIDHQNWDELFDFCQRKRKFLNQTFPCTSLDDKAPYQAFPHAKHSGKFYHPLLEEQIMNLDRVYAYLDKGKWYRRTSQNKSITLGGVFYYLSNAKKKASVQITFDSKTLMLSFHDDKEHLLQKLPIKGIDKKTLMGDVFWKMANVQLELPLYWDTQKATTTFLHNT
jgi:transposase InsO family protein